MKENQQMWRSDTPATKNPLRFFLFASRPHWKAALVATTFVIFAASVSASVSYIFKLITNAVTALPQGGSYTPVLWWCMAAVVFLGFAKLFWRISGFAGALWATGASATARYALSSYVTLHSRSYFSDRFAGSLMNKIRHAATDIREFVDMFLWEFLELTVNAVVSFAIILLVNGFVAAIFFVWVTLIVGINVYLGKRRVPLAKYAHDLETLTNSATVDLLTNIGAMQEYARREFEIDRLKSAANNRRIAHLKSWYYGEWTRVVNSVLLFVFGSAMVITIVYLAKNSLVSLGDIILVITIIFRIEGLLQSLGSNINKFSETWGEMEESLEEIVEPHEIPDKPLAQEISVVEGAIELQNVTFGYAGDEIFSNLSLSIKGGERVGLVGRSGAGKSTLMRLLLHHHDVAAGTIAIDGTNIASVRQDSLRRAISVVPQEPLLFHRTIRENIAYGNPGASEEDVINASKLAQSHDFIMRLSAGYKALVGERGVKLSGGERQRIAIARAILKNAPILLLDEATSSLDSESEVAIQEALHELMQQKTVIAIAHRLSTLREMDRIIVLDRGAIVEEGTHRALIEKKGLYAELWNHQAGGFLQDE